MENDSLLSDSALTEELIAAAAHVQALSEQMLKRRIKAMLLNGHSALACVGYGATGKLSVGITTKVLHEPTRN